MVYLVREIYGTPENIIMPFFSVIIIILLLFFTIIIIVIIIVVVAVVLGLCEYLGIYLLRAMESQTICGCHEGYNNNYC